MFEIVKNLEALMMMCVHLTWIANLDSKIIWFLHNALQQRVITEPGPWLCGIY